MKPIRTLALATAAALAVGGLAHPALAAPGPSERPCPPSTTTPTRTASATLAEDLTFIREEERLARDLYRAFAEEYGSGTVFDRIASSEQRHFDAVGRLLAIHGLDDPSEGLAPGTYADDSLTAMYEELLAQGMDSIEGAYEAGIAVEVADIQDLTEASARTDSAVVKRVLGNLTRASERHLAAFTAHRDGAVEARPGRGAAQEAQPTGKGQQGQGKRGQGPRAVEDRPAGCPRN